MNSSPYLDIPLVDYEDNKAKNIDKIFNEYIYFNINTICGEKFIKLKTIDIDWLIDILRSIKFWKFLYFFLLKSIIMIKKIMLI